MVSVKSEDRAPYGENVELSDDAVIAKALQILEARIPKAEWAVSGPSDVTNYLRLKLGGNEQEEFFAVFLNARNEVLAMVPMFQGTLTQCSVYPREVVKAALARNAAAVIFAHNHPSGGPEPSQSDIMLTGVLKNALGLVDVRVLDHIVVTAGGTTSMAERGMI